MFFDPSKVDDSDDFKSSVIPAGIYRAMVDKAEFKQNKKQNGDGVAVNFSVVEGPHKGATLFNWFNLNHTTEQAAKIGRSEFKRFLTAVGITQALSQETELQRVVNKTLYVKVDIGEYNGAPSNNIKKFSASQNFDGPQRPLPPPTAADSIPF